MKKIIVFTNPTSWNGLPQDPMPLVDQIDLIKEGPLSVYLNESFDVSPVESINENGSLFLIYDEIPQDDYNNFINGYNDELFILYHKNDNRFNLKFPETSKIILKEGSHTSSYDSGYKELSELLYKNVFEFEKIIENVFNINRKLNISLEFLHKCLLRPVTAVEIENLVKDLGLDEESIRVINECSDNSYKNLSDARDVLLKTL